MDRTNSHDCSPCVRLFIELLFKEVGGVNSSEFSSSVLRRARRDDETVAPAWATNARVGTCSLSSQETKALEQDAWMEQAGYSRHPGSMAHFAEEIADVVISAYALAAVTGVDLHRAIQDKHTILEIRDWTAGSSPEGS